MAHTASSFPPKPEHFHDTSPDDDLKIAEKPSSVLRRANKILRSIKSIEDFNQHRSEVFDIAWSIEQIEKIRGKRIMNL